MDFDLSEEQRMLKESVERLIGERYDFEQRKSYMKEPAASAGPCGSNMQTSACSACPFPEKYGGSGGGAIETMIVMEAFGRGLHAGTLSCDRRHGRRHHRVGGQRSPTRRHPAAHRQRRSPPRSRLLRAAITLRPGRCSPPHGAMPTAGSSTAPRVSSRMATAPTSSSCRRASRDRRSEDGIGLFLVDANSAGVESTRISHARWSARGGSEAYEREATFQRCAR